ncbi:MAG: MBL fold metallo-hydrolase [Paenibacillus lautus]|jgi:glyoxylase-like metal-dependent hydrolase (beta-lactamase superfamily II)|uniref:MBL fold metallo-hydrolase n=1 Tax=Paenibacillus lautus TaxID=1401 RepID=UPI0026F0DBA9|nr:MBL fold metallo-hydrolase [Paenibacillus lautus]MCI1775420.1 MBL fold metallo-hydrolase [Paenibacillus lautus]
MLKTTIEQVTQISFLPRLFPINVYLVEESDGVTLIDAGMSFSQKGILQAAADTGKPIKRIVLTHAHGDHVGALDGLKKELPNASVCISRRDALLLKGSAELQPGEPQTPIRGDIPKNVTTVPDVLLEDGDSIGSLKAIATPGHTPGHMAFLDERSGILIAGDAWQTRGGLAVSGVMKPWFPFPAMATWSKEQALESAGMLTALKPAVLAVGHGRMLRNPAGAMQQAVTVAESTLRRNAR